MPIKIRIHFRIEGGIKHHKTIIIENFMISKPQLPTLLNGILHTKKRQAKYAEPKCYRKE